MRCLTWTDLQYVNGNSISAPEMVNPIDPKLRNNGSNPGRDAVPILAGGRGPASGDNPGS